MRFSHKIRKCIGVLPSRVFSFGFFVLFKGLRFYMPDLLHNSFIPSIKEKSFNWTLFSLICTKASLPRIFSKFLSPSWKVEFWQDQNFVSSKWMDSHFRKLLHEALKKMLLFSLAYAWEVGEQKNIIFPLNGFIMGHFAVMESIFFQLSLFLDSYFSADVAKKHNSPKDVNIRGISRKCLRCQCHWQ